MCLWYYNSGISVVLRMQNVEWMLLNLGLSHAIFVKEVIHEHPLSPFTLTTAIIVGYLALFSVYWLFCFLRFFAQLKDTLDSRHFYYNR